MSTCQHTKQPELTYAQGYEDAKQRRRRGECQIRCSNCRKWIWEEFWPRAILPLDNGGGMGDR